MVCVATTARLPSSKLMFAAECSASVTANLRSFILPLPHQLSSLSEAPHVDSTTSNTTISRFFSKMADTAGSQAFFNSPKYSDLTVVCDSDVYNLHRAIICPRSTWFDKACDGSFKVRQVNGRLSAADVSYRRLRIRRSLSKKTIRRPSTACLFTSTLSTTQMQRSHRIKN